MNRKTRIVGAVAAIVLLIGTAIWRSSRSSPGESRAMASAAGDAASPPASAARPPPSAEASSAMSATPSTRRPKQADDALCIVKAPPVPRIASGADGDSPFVEIDPAPPPSAAVVAARRRIEANLRASADPYANAVAIWLDVPGDEDTDGRLLAERDRKLAALAMHTRDPRLYALALRACWHKPGRECGALSARQWAVLDPDNAMPWALMLDDAAADDDESSLQEAMHHLTQSKRFDEGDYAPVAAILDAAGDDESDLAAAFMLSTDAIGVAAAQIGPKSVSVCRYAAQADANVRQQCLAMRDLLENHSDSIVLRMAGASIDQQLTGNAMPMKRVMAQIDRLSAAFPGSTTGCRDLHAQVDLLRRAAAGGPVAAFGESSR